MPLPFPDPQYIGVDPAHYLPLGLLLLGVMAIAAWQIIRRKR